MGQALDDGDLYAHGVPHGGELGADDAAAQNDSALGQVVHLQGFGGGEHTVTNLDTESLGDRTGCQDDVLALVIGASDGDGVLAGELAFALDDGDLLHLEKAGQALELAGDDAVLVVTNLSHIDGLEGGVYTVL